MVLQYDHQIIQGRSKVSWHGSIDENWDNNIASLPDALLDRADFYFTDIENINSIGIRLWTQFINEVSYNRHIEFWDCPSLIVRLLSVSDAFKGSATIRSFFVALDCPNCEAELAIRYSTDQKFETIAEEVANFTCKGCQSKMSFQDDPDIYESFLKDSSTSGSNS